MRPTGPLVQRHRRVRAQGFTFAGNAGLPLGPEGFLNLSLEHGGTQPTNRAVQDGGTLSG